jgi:hypothetical protein
VEGGGAEEEEGPVLPPLDAAVAVAEEVARAGRPDRGVRPARPAGPAAAAGGPPRACAESRACAASCAACPGPAVGVAGRAAAGRQQQAGCCAGADDCA